MSRKPSSGHKLQADSIRELEVALQDEADRLHAKGLRNFEGGKDWLTPGRLLNWIVAAFLAMGPDEREEFAVRAGRREFDRLLASPHPLYLNVLGAEPAESEAGGGAGATMTAADSQGNAARDVAPEKPGRKSKRR